MTRSEMERICREANRLDIEIKQVQRHSSGAYIVTARIRGTQPVAIIPSMDQWKVFKRDAEQP